LFEQFCNEYGCEEYDCYENHTHRFGFLSLAQITTVFGITVQYRSDGLRHLDLDWFKYRSQRKSSKPASDFKKGLPSRQQIPQNGLEWENGQPDLVNLGASGAAKQIIIGADLQSSLPVPSFTSSNKKKIAFSLQVPANQSSFTG
jgi:hypothetical protein